MVVAWIWCRDKKLRLLMAQTPVRDVTESYLYKPLARLKVDTPTQLENSFPFNQLN